MEIIIRSAGTLFAKPVHLMETRHANTRGRHERRGEKEEQTAGNEPLSDVQLTRAYKVTQDMRSSLSRRLRSNWSDVHDWPQSYKSI